jgi:hypothetical protein
MDKWFYIFCRRDMSLDLLNKELQGKNKLFREMFDNIKTFKV